ncbi:hypothetical protein [Lentzea sp. NBRC 105346]|uniref:hypothetical protein n=1 Tax=Lentzea sp. NBRC 105346 TaxID=3032205 RepID=UPI0025545F98|nr:hypothetical protein [Lentzea sp. NBRC 105346]
MHELNVALNESTVVGLRQRPDGSVVLLLQVLALSADRLIDPDARRAIVLSGPSRSRILLRRQGSDFGPVIPLADFDAVEEFFASVALYNSMYGWEFLDNPNLVQDWPAEVSLDVTHRDTPAEHTLYWFNEVGVTVEDGYRLYCIEGVVEYDELTVERFDGTPVPVDEFTAAGKRWWEAFYGGDPRADEVQRAVNESPAWR